MKIAAASTRKTVVDFFEKRLNRGNATIALPAPMPRMNAISTMANACSEEPKISARQRDAKISNPIETAPVNATTKQAQ